MIRPLLAALAPALIAGCLAVGGARRPCPEGSLASLCQTHVVDKCGVSQPIIRTFLCIPYTQNFMVESQINASILAKNANCINEINTVCSPLPASDGNSLPPLDDEPDAEIEPAPPKRPENVGGPACSDCAAVKCAAEFQACDADPQCVCHAYCFGQQKTREQCIAECGQPVAGDATDVATICLHAQCEAPCYGGGGTCGCAQ